MELMLKARTPAVLATLALISGCTQHEAVHVATPEGHWISIFNGKNLDGWTVKIATHDVNDNYGDTFRVENGLLKVSYDHYDRFGRQFGSLFYNTKLSHYWIRAEYRFVGEQAPGAPSWAYKDSGIQLHSQAPQTMSKDQEFPVSVEFNLIGGRWLKRPTGDVCRNGTTVTMSGAALTSQCSKTSAITIRGSDWVTVAAEVNGSRHVRQIVNGTLVAEYGDIELDGSDSNARRLLDAGASKSLSAGYISLQSNSHPIEFRKIEILPLDGADSQH
jgi:hypothetical protein